MNKKIVKKLKKVIHIILGIVIALSLYQPVDVMAADLSFQNNAISNVNNNDARISAQIINSNKMNVTETGFYLGTSSGDLNKCTKNDSGNWKYSKISVGFTMSQYWGNLSENTTYYYRFCAIADGKEYTSNEYSFKTTGGNTEKTGLSFYENNVTDVTENNGRINAKISNPDGRRVTETGFYIGTSPEVSKNGMNDSCSLTDSTITVGYTMSKYYGTLQPGTTYYYKFYAIGDGQEYCSETYSFTTVSVPKPAPEPEPEPTPIPTPERPKEPEVGTATEEEVSNQTQGEVQGTSENNGAKAALSFYDNSITKLTESDARISAKISNPDGRRVTETGFYIGTSPEVSKNGMNDSCSLTDSTITVGYTMSKYYGTLQPGTTYYYKFYAIGDGQEYCSETYSFTTVSVPEPTPEPEPETTSIPTPERPEKPETGTATEEEVSNQTQGEVQGTSENNGAKAALSFYDNSITKLTESDARISAKISNPDERRVTETGFYIGTSEQLYRNAKHDNCDLSDKMINVGYTMSAYYGVLEPGTTYYCVFYAIGDGEEFISDVYTFTTKNVQQTTVSGENKETDNSPKESKISFSVKKVENITHENARIRAEVKNPNKEKITETGFYYGSDKTNMIKSIESDKGNWETGITVSYDIGEYARICLMPDKTYYFRFYVIVDGQEVVSEINAFTTTKESKKEDESNNSIIEEVQDSNVSNNYKEEIVKDNVVSEKETSNSNKKTYTINLNANGGKVNPQSIKVAKDECYGSLPIPVREGYIFEGWYRNYVFWKEYVTETSVYRRGLGIIDTLNAKWREKNEFYVKFDANGGSVNESMRLVYEQDTLGNLPVPNREGYDFVGWYTESVGGKQVNADKVISGNEICYAQWKEQVKESARFSQNDAEWTAQNSSFKKKYPGSLIKKQGCYLCSLAMSLNNMGFRDTTPITLYERNLDDKGNPDSYIHDDSIKSWYNSYMKKNGINKKLVHDTISISNNDYQSVLKDTLLGSNNSGRNEKKYHLEQGVIVKLKKNGSENYHYILATHIADDGTIRVNDPDNSNNNGGVWDKNIQTVLKEERLKSYKVVGLELWYLK